MLEFIKECPVCSGNRFSVFLEGKDFFLTKEHFTIQICDKCGFKFTNPRPDNKSILKYYESDKYVSHDAKKADFTTTIYRIARYYAIRKKHSIIKSCSPGKRLLDIGCGTAELLNYCRKKGMEVKGVEPNEKAREFARKNHSLCVLGSLDEVKKTTEKFDCISLWHVFEHLPSLDQTLNDVASILENGGVVIIAVPNSESWDARHYQKFWAAYDLPRHLYHFSEITLKRLVENHGFFITETKPQKLDAFYISLLSEEYKTGKRSFFKAVINGMRSNFLAGRRSCGYSSTIFVIKRKNS